MPGRLTWLEAVFNGGRAGASREGSDAGLVRLAVAQVPRDTQSEHHWLQTCYGRLGHLLPHLPHQPS